MVARSHGRLRRGADSRAEWVSPTGAALFCLALIGAAAGCATTPSTDVWNSSQTRAAQFRTSEKPQKGEIATPEILAMFEAGDEEEYRLGGGDKIKLEVWGRPELSGPRIVGPDGRITVPVIGSVAVQGLTADDAAKAVTQALSHAYRDVTATVSIDEYTANRVLVLGRVSNPGVVQFDTQPTLLEAITKAGSLPVGGIGADKAALTRCAVFRGRDRVVWIDLKSLLTGRNLALNLRLRRDDVVYLPDASDQLVYILGEVHKPGAYTLTPDMSVLDAVSTAGGPTWDAAWSKIQLVRPGMYLDERIDMDVMIDAADPSQNYALEEGDIIYVPRNKVGKLGWFLRHISPLTGMAAFGAAVAP